MSMTYMDKNGDIHAIKGDTFDLLLYDIKEDDVLIPFTGWKAKFQARVYPNDTECVIDLDETSGIDLTTAGIIRIINSAAAMELLNACEYVYDLELTRADNTVETWFLKKKLFLEQDTAR